LKTLQSIDLMCFWPRFATRHCRQNARLDSKADFLGREPLASFNVNVGSVVNRGSFPMDFASPLLSKLSIVAAYIAFAFVGAIILGVF